MYDDSYSLYFSDRAVGQSTPTGYSLKDKFKLNLPNDSNLFDNRAVGQSINRYADDEFIAPREPVYYNNGYGGFTPIIEPMNNPTNPTQIYGSGATTTIAGVAIAIILVAVVVIVTAYLAKKYGGK